MSFPFKSRFGSQRLGTHRFPVLGVAKDELIVCERLQNLAV
jgi:hypothetical protein